MHRAALLAAGLLLGAAGTAEACPDWELSPYFGQLVLNEGFEPDPQRIALTGGGDQSLAACDFGVNGWVASAPDYDLYYQTTGGFPLTIAVESAGDTILLVRGPDGRYYFDDDGGAALGMQNGAVVFFPTPLPGLYDIWIGSRSQASGLAATLIITELLD